MTRCVGRFKDGNAVNIEADGIIRDGETVEVWKRVPIEKVLEKGVVYETVGVFAERVIDYIYMSESKGETK